MTSKQYGHVSISISDCQKIFELNRYAPEQILDLVFSNNKTKPLPKNQFINTFKSAFSGNVDPENLSKVDAAAARVYEVCSQGQSEISVEQLGKGIGVFTARREPIGILRDLFFYLDRDGKTVIQEGQIQAFIKEASDRGINFSISNDLAALKQQVISDKGNFEFSYWTFYIWRNHPALKTLVVIFKEVQDSKQALLTASPNRSPTRSIEQEYVKRSPVMPLPDDYVERPSGDGFVERGGGEITISKEGNEESEKIAGLYQNNPMQQAATPSMRQQAVPMFGGDEGILARDTQRLHCFEEFLELGSKMGFHAIPAKEFLRKRKDFFLHHKKVYGDIMLHEFIKMSVDMFMKPGDDYYAFTEGIIQLFQFMDINDNGILEINEALQGLVHLFGGTEEDKIIAAFMLFDTDDSGFIEFNEVYGFIYATIKLKEYHGNVYKHEDLLALKKIAYETAMDVFKTMDVDHNGKVTVEEFMAWFRTTKGEIKPGEIEAARSLKQHRLKNFVQKVQVVKELKKNKGPWRNLNWEALKKSIADQKADTFVVEEIRAKIPFERIHIQMAVESLKTQAPSGVVNYTQFSDFIRFLLKQHSLPGQEHVQEVGRKLFNALDSNKNGILEISEIATGLGLVCGGNQIEKMKAGFDLFDLNNDKVLSFEETTNFMGSFFKLIQVDNPNITVYNQEPHKYALSLAYTIFQECGIPLNGFLEFWTLKKWVQNLSKQEE